MSEICYFPVSNSVNDTMSFSKEIQRNEQSFLFCA
jgi:hypothetical protein